MEVGVSVRQKAQINSEKAEEMAKKLTFAGVRKLPSAQRRALGKALAQFIEMAEGYKYTHQVLMSPHPLQY
jgi:hypothetical protein